MTILTLDQFFLDVARIALTFDLSAAIETNTTASGEVLRSDYGARLWRGSASVAPLRSAEIEVVKSRIHRLEDADGSFFVSPMHMQRPLSGPGAILDIRNGREMQLSGLEAGQVLSEGEFLSYSYGANPTRYALHQARATVVANGAGSTDWFEVTPTIPATAAISAAVIFDRPICKAYIVPGTVSPAIHAAGHGEGLAFEWKQTLR